MGLIDAGTVDFLLSFKLVRTDEDGERTLALLIGVRFAPGDELLFRFLEVGAEDFALVILLDDAVDFVIKAISSTGLDFHKHELNPVGKEHSAHEKEAISAIVDYIYSDFDAFTLLLTKSAGSTHENFLQEICDLYTKNVMVILDWMKSQNLIKNKIDPMTVHVTATTFITSVTEIVYHKMPREEAEVFLDNMQAFFHFGYMHMMGVNCSEE